MKGLANRVALVTGATGLLGGAIVRRLAAEGATVAVASRQLEKAQKWIEENSNELTTKLISVELNLADEASIASTFKQLGEQIGVPTILIANASRREGLAESFTQLSHQNFNQLFEVDVAGHFLCARQLVERLTLPTTASIVFLSSVYALIGIDHSIYPDGMVPTPVQYVAVKSGIVGLTRFLAAKWGSAGVRVNAVAAGGVRSPARQNEEFVHNYTRKTMLGRMATPEEVASAVAFLASDEAAYITGTCLAVDGGMSAW